MSDPCLRGAIVVNGSEGGFLIETTSNIPVGKELNVTRQNREEEFEVPPGWT